MNGSSSKKIYGPPPSYEENIRQRQFKRKSYAYFNVEDKQQEGKKVGESLQREFSFENIRSRLVVSEKGLIEQSTVVQSNINSSKPIYKRQNSKKQQFSLHASNINSISDKIADLLNLVNRDRGQGNEQRQGQKQIADTFVPYGSRFSQNRQSIISQVSPFDNVCIDVKQGGKGSSGWMQMVPVLAEIDNRIHDKLKRRLSKYDKPLSHGDKEDYSFNKTQIITQVCKPNQRLTVLQSVKYPQESIHIKSGQQLKFLQRIKDKSRIYHYNADMTENSSSLSKRYTQQTFKSINKERRKIVVERNRELDSRITRINNEIIQRSLRNQQEKEGYLFATEKQSERFKDVSVSQGEQQSKPTILRMAQKMSQHIDMEIEFRNLRESFEYYSNVDKWESLLRQFKVQGVTFDQTQLRSVMHVSIHEKNPFKNKVDPFPENGVKELVRFYCAVEQFWAKDLQKCVSARQLNQQGFQMAYIDINKKGAISIEDMVCFINVNSRRFYRSRDLAATFHRFLRLQTKSIERHITEGVQYSTFMNKLTE